MLIRYPGIGHTNAHKISEFADGNAKVSLALAERVKENETLASLTDAELFDRLFQQRNEPDGELRKHAEVLSLVYSYAVEQVEDGTNELAVLGGLINASVGQLYRSTSTLLERQVAQKRGRWRAILPHAIANRLASSALNGIHQGVLKTMLENPANRRLLKSFAHRLGIMHDHTVAQDIVRDWLSAGGLLANIAQLDDEGARILEYVAPVAPAVVLDRIETWINAPDFTGMDLQYSTPRTMIINLLVSLAYEPAAFDRCARLLIRIADFEDSTNSHSYYVRDRIIQLFQPYLSGTHATLDQREAVLREMLVADDPKRRELGLKMLSTALGGPSWTGMGMNEFGAHPRDFGYSPDYQQLVDWHHRFIDVAVDAGLDDDRNLSNGARATLAQKFRWLWRQSDVRKRLVEAARVLNDHQYWAEGRKAVRATIHFDYR